jgi:hypothetical protein
MIAQQIEFPLVVAVCAWCKPKRDAGAGIVSHGICLRHLRKVKMELQNLGLKRSGRSTGGRSRRRRECEGEALLPL